MTVPSNLVPTPISGLPLSGTPTVADSLMIVQNGATYRATLGSIFSVYGNFAVPTSRVIGTGVGLDGGGDLTQDRLIYMIDTGVTPGTYGSSARTPVITVNLQGQLTAAGDTDTIIPFANVISTPTSLAGYGIIDAQPLNINLSAISQLGTNGIMTKTGSGAISTLSILNGTGINVTNGSGLAGDITIDLANTSVTPGLYGSFTTTPIITVDQQGRLTNVANATITPAWSSITNTPTTLAGYGITDGALNTTTFAGINSISGGGALNTNRTFQLVNDLAAPGNSKYYGTDGTGTRGWFAFTSTGTVTSVGLSAPSDFIVSGSPITSSGTLALTYATQNSKKFLAGPISGADATPTFRVLAASDLPTTSVPAGSYGTTTDVASFTVDAQGRLTAAANIPIALPPSGLTVNTTTITGGVNGQILYDNAGTVGELASVPIANGGTGQTTKAAGFNALSPITSTGDLIIGNGTNSATRLAIGANTYILTSNGTTATWAAPPATGITINTTAITGGTTGRILYDNAGTVGELSAVPIANGGTGQVTASAAFNALSPITTAGDIIIGNGANSATRLAIGANTYVLTSNGTTATWSAPSFTYPGAGIAVSTGSAWGTSLTAPTGTIVGTTDSQTLTNKRVTPRIVSITSSATITPDGDGSDQYEVTALATTASIAAPSGTPTDGQKLIIRIKDNGVAQTLSWNSAYRAVAVVLPTATVAGKVFYAGCIWNAQDNFWDVVTTVQL